MTKPRARRMVRLLVAAAFIAGCSEQPLSGIGHIGEQWIAGGSPPTAPPAAVDGALTGVDQPAGEADAMWFNQDSGALPGTSPAATIAMVWDRSNHRDQFVQASRSEIVRALPGVGFPGLIPTGAGYITSQLVFDPLTGDLASDAVAAFGFWSTRPYSKSRSVAQLAVLMVSVDEPPPEPVVVDTIGVAQTSPDDATCHEPLGGDVQECRALALENGSLAWSVALTNGWRLVWVEGGYRYDLFVRDAADAELAARMAASCRPLAARDSAVALGS